MTPASHQGKAVTLITHLTFGWPEISDQHWSRSFLLTEEGSGDSNTKNREFKTQLQTLLAKKNSPYELEEVDALFRKSTKGFQPIKRFIASLSSLDKATVNNEPVHCHIDVFAYSFLKGAKNFDLLLPYQPQKSQKNDQEFLDHYQKWLSKITALEIFERTGQPPEETQLAEQYKQFRKILVRSSARDELRALGTLLISGPSTTNMISQDLGLNYDLGQRVMTVFEPAGIVTYRGRGFYSIATDAIPLAVFGLREVLGIDLLSSLMVEV